MSKEKKIKRRTSLKLQLLSTQNLNDFELEIVCGGGNAESSQGNVDTNVPKESEV